MLTKLAEVYAPLARIEYSQFVPSSCIPHSAGRMTPSAAAPRVNKPSSSCVTRPRCFDLVVSYRSYILISPDDIYTVEYSPADTPSRATGVRPAHAPVRRQARWVRARAEVPPSASHDGVSCTLRRHGAARLGCGNLKCRCGHSRERGSGLQHPRC